MPKQTATKGFPCDPKDCYESRHLEGPDYKIYDLMLACSPEKNGKRVFYAPVVPWLCNAANQSRSAVDATLDRLEGAGWIISHGRTRRADGTESPNTYEIIEHDAWAMKHPGKCPDYKYAPDHDTATKHGVSKGDKLPTNATRRPWNFIKDEFPVLDTVEGRAIAEVMGKLSDDEQQVVLENWKAISGNIEADRAKQANSHGGPGVAPLTVDQENLSRWTGKTTHGLP